MIKLRMIVLVLLFCFSCSREYPLDQVAARIPDGVRSHFMKELENAQTRHEDHFIYYYKIASETDAPPLQYFFSIVTRHSDSKYYFTSSLYTEKELISALEKLGKVSTFNVYYFK
jgi:hypothetical protein